MVVVSFSTSINIKVAPLLITKPPGYRTIHLSNLDAMVATLDFSVLWYITGRIGSSRPFSPLDIASFNLLPAI